MPFAAARSSARIASTVSAARSDSATGLSMNEDGVQDSEDLELPTRNALLAMIDYVVETYGYTREQAYALCSVAVDLSISEIVDVPNFVVSAFLPLDIFV